MRVSYAIVFVSDMKRSVAFYRDVIGLPLKFDSPEWSEFSTEGATLALHRSDEAAPTSEEPELPAGRCRPGLNVPDLDAFHVRMVEHDVICTQQPKDLFGSRIAQYLDPDGLAISVSEERR
ncbi:MAG TPA: VOC family protein [Vicinamibacterales bacterium]|nr:VOC family protein [Vicinamibacterales bacterium]